MRSEQDLVALPDAARSVGICRDAIYDAIGRGQLTQIIGRGAIFLVASEFAAWAQAHWQDLLGG
ncbi:MAG TPA: hypothetical protein VHM89_12805 [Acidimicrobiales bacterium]|nr:hypothetical protein [Acidimicrobiales bacterium]